MFLGKPLEKEKSELKHLISFLKEINRDLESSGERTSEKRPKYLQQRANKRT